MDRCAGSVAGDGLAKVASTLHGAAGYDAMTAISSPDPQGSVHTLLIRFLSLSLQNGSDLRYGTRWQRMEIGSPRRISKPRRE